MLQKLRRVISYPDGRVVFYYNDKEVTYRKDREEPEILNKKYNEKGNYGLLDWTPNLHFDSSSFSRY